MHGRGLAAVLALVTLSGCARGNTPVREAVAPAGCYAGSGLEQAFTPAMAHPSGPTSATLVLDSVAEPGGKQFHARLAAGDSARAGIWYNLPHDTIAVTLTGVYPMVVLTLERQARRLTGTAQRAAMWPGTVVDTTRWPVDLAVTPCASVLARLHNENGRRPPLPDSVRTELVVMDSTDQVMRKAMNAATFADTSFMRRLERSDSARTARLKEIVARWGWPTPSRAGETAANGAFLVLQHSPSLQFQRRLLPVLDTLARAGELSSQDVALLTDRTLKRQGLPQRYGTQFGVKDGRLVRYEIEDSARVDARRAAMGLPPMAVYEKVVRQQLHLAPAGG